MATETPTPDIALAGSTSALMRVGEVSLHYVAAGTGEPVILLHGFPEFWYSWRRQIRALADAGFHAVAPDLRGYNQSDQPQGVDDYRTARLVEDIAGLIQGIGGGPAMVVGHDWGGILAWRLAALHPRLVRRLVVMNAPHPAAFSRELAHNPLQWVRSSYALFFQLPWLPEWMLRAGDFTALEQAFRRQPVHSDAFSDADIQAYKQAFAGPGSLTGPLNYYRAAIRHRGDLQDPPHSIESPTLLLWGEQDPFLSVQLSEGLERWVPDLRVVRFDDASHWIQNDVPDRVNQQLIDFFTA